VEERAKIDDDLAEYHQYITGKSRFDNGGGFEVVDPQWDHLFPFQADVLRWSLKRGRAAAFLDTGLGKTRLQTTFANEVVKHHGDDARFLIVAPLAVAQQTIADAATYGIDVRYVRNQNDVQDGISITNYEMLHAFDAPSFVGVALDESSILKNFDGKTRNALIEAFARTRYKLACTATPSPNDFTELGNHAEFLGVMSRVEMLSMYFIHDGSGTTAEWRLKGHARARFWQWVCGWGAMVRKPSDLGYPDDGYDLPPLLIQQHTIASTVEQARAQGKLFVEPAKGLNEQRSAKRATISDRVAMAAKLANSIDGQVLVWCELNDESSACTKAIKGAVEVKGSDTPEEKASRLSAFARGETRALITKTSIAGMGLNFQQSSNQIFVGATNSFEDFYQAARRQWRFGQTRPVVVDVIASELDGNVLDNLKRKQDEAERMGNEMAEFTRDIVRANVRGLVRDVAEYNPTQPMQLPTWMVTT